jgi:hypothetical protein
MDLVDSKIAELRKRQIEIPFELKQQETIAAKRQSCSGDVAEAICQLKSEFMDLVEVLDHFSDIGRKRDFWEAFLCSEHEIPLFSGFPELVNKYAKPLLEDRDLVLKLCVYSERVYFHLSGDFKQDEGIVEVVLTKCPQNVLGIGEDVQQMYPALVASALERLDLSSPDCQDVAYPNVHYSLWWNRNVALAWASAGGHFLDNFPDEFNDDEEILVAFLQNGDDDELKPTPRLLADKQFMLKAVKASQYYLAKVPKELAGDWDLLLAAMGNSINGFLDWNQLYKGGWVQDPAGDVKGFWIDKAKTVREKLQTHDIFVKLVLGGIMASAGGSITPLTLLNQGKETTLAFTKPIAEYLGVPMGEELHLLRKARKKLADKMRIDC